MPRRFRIEFEGAIFPVTARGNVRQKIVRDDADRRRLIECSNAPRSASGLCYDYTLLFLRIYIS
jgi:hypothetical protein